MSTALSMRLARPSLLSDVFTLLRNARVDNGAGGGRASWVEVATARGRSYAVRVRQHEIAQGGKASDVQIIEFVLELTGIDGSWRIMAADGSTFEIVSVGEQPPVSIVRGRRV